MMKKFFILILAIISLSGCTQVNSETYCSTDADCACGKHVSTGDCFYGNKDYVNTKEQCPDYCTGISGTFSIKCENNECFQVREI